MVDGAWFGVLAVAAGCAVAVAVGIAVLRRRFVVVTVRGPSMEPSLHEGDRVLVRRRRLAALRTGDLVVFAEIPAPSRPPTRPDLSEPTPPSRPGWPDPPHPDTSPVPPPQVPDLRRVDTAEGWLIKRAIALPGDPVPRDAGPALAVLDDEVVPPGRLVAIGDNRGFSYDSRHYGYVTADRLLGAVLRRI
ncbi:S26 family signal peptidase [Plantactinospora sonchi]|uniref:Mitochondrial inner membrane protease subunit 2 n=1 Tax=Plantactinospora sonchi TaxID=1544735 RepID=A0ABU7RNG7_9ACTN